MRIYSLLLLMAFASTAMEAKPSVRYHLSMPNPSTHLLEVELTYGNLQAGEQTLDLLLPVWRPGRYMVMDFASGVVSFSAADGRGKPLLWSKIEKSKWRIETNGSSTVTARYTVYADEFGLRTRGLNDGHAFLDGTSAFMYAEKYRHLPLTLTVLPYKNWHVTTGLEGDGKDFTAPDYDYLVDCPVEVGNQKDFKFEVGGIPHILSIYGEGNWNADTLIRDIEKIVRTERNFWGEFPYKKYVFLIHCSPVLGGGTEHINSCVIGTRPFVFRNPDFYHGFLSVVAHEYFHTWNVKQLRPKGMHPYDYTKENYSRELWIAEGTTSYYDDLMMLRAGFQSADKYADGVAGRIQGDRQRPGNAVQPLSEASFDAWVKYWRGNEQAFNTESDYYGKGASVSMLLDLGIRRTSGNKSSLDDVMRKMYSRFPLSGPGYTLDDFRGASEECAGGKMDQFFDDYVYGTKDLPWEEYVGYAGLRVVRKDSTAKPWIGLGTNDAGEKTKVTFVVAGSPAEDAGLNLGDELLALNGLRIRSYDLRERIGDLAPGDSLTLHVFRDESLREFRLKVGKTPVPDYRIEKIQNPSDLQKEIYALWLKTPLSKAAAEDKTGQK